MKNVKITLICFALSIMVMGCYSQKKLRRLVEPDPTISIVKEKLEDSPIFRFLHTQTQDREIFDLFIHDSSKYSILIDSRMYITYAYLKDSTQWEVFRKKTGQWCTIDNDSLELTVQNYANKNAAYTVVCPDDISASTTINLTEYVWIKEYGELKFIYYNKDYGVTFLNDEDRKEIKLLKDLINLLFLLDNDCKFLPANNAIKPKK